MLENKKIQLAEQRLFYVASCFWSTPPQLSTSCVREVCKGAVTFSTHSWLTYILYAHRQHLKHITYISWAHARPRTTSEMCTHTNRNPQTTTSNTQLSLSHIARRGVNRRGEATNQRVDREQDDEIKPESEKKTNSHETIKETMKRKERYKTEDKKSSDKNGKVALFNRTVWKAEAWV